MNKLQQLALSRTKGVGAKTLRSLLLHCGSPEEVFKASRKELSAIPNLGTRSLEAILSKESWKEAEVELTLLNKEDISILWTEDQNYPHRLRHCEDAPLLLYHKGKAKLNPKHAISIVGTRNATAYGKQICAELISSLNKLEDTLIISGLAYGIDIQAHRLALKHNIPTIGILGHGFSYIYPAAHREVANKMLEEGALLTEFSFNSKPERMNFPARNRIIAGLSDVTIVVEAAKKGGALITAEIANSYNRDVCAYPGGIDQVYSEGCNYLIKTNRAHLIRHADDLFYLMGWDQVDNKTIDKQLNLLKPTRSKQEEAICIFLENKQEASIDMIAQHLSWPMSQLAILLLEMELNEHIVSLPGKIYKNL